MQQALDSPAAAKGLDDSYQPVPDVRDDPAYFARLYDQYATDVLRVCYFYLSDREKAEDVCQDVFVRLMTTHPLLQPGREKSWLLKVALNRCRDLWRGAPVPKKVKEVLKQLHEGAESEDDNERN